MSDDSQTSHIAIISLGDRDLRCRDTTTGEYYAPRPDRDRDKGSLEKAFGLPKPTVDGKAAFVGARTVGDFVQKQLVANRVTLDDLRYPMIKPFLKRACGIAPLSKVVLVATDQARPDNVQRLGQWEQDTVEIAQVIRILIENDYPDLPVDFIFVREDPHLFEKAYGQIDNPLQSIWNDTKNSVERRVTVIATGGTPAITQALVQHAAGLWRYGQCVVFRADEPPYKELLDGTGESDIKVTDLLPVIRAIGRDIMRAQIQSYGYVDALYTLRGLGFSGDSRRVERLLEYSAARLDLRFEDALDHLRPNATEYSNPSSWLSRLVSGEPRDRALLQLAELYWSADVRWQQEEFVEFLWRAAAIYELALQIIVAQASKEGAFWGTGPFPASEIKSPDIKDRLERRNGGFMLECGDWASLADQLCIDGSDLNVLIEAKTLRPVWKRRNEALHNAMMPTRQAFEGLFLSDDRSSSGTDHLKRVVKTVFTWLNHDCDVSSSPYDAVNADLEAELHQVLKP